MPAGKVVIMIDEIVDTLVKVGASDRRAALACRQQAQEKGFAQF